YDPMIAKLITTADTRDEALDRLSLALDEMSVFGVVTNRVFLKKLLNLEETRSSTFYTVLIDDKFDEWDLSSSTRNPNITAIASYFWLQQQRSSNTREPWAA
ncbi:MAG TPA: carbamoyl-phosphate synthase subunit L, partial [Gammaproteobacteria bacterium]|nr:carbamoyl-phosphate synthase subunit L [Gammaproteobacteria bacterium]